MKIEKIEEKGPDALPCAEPLITNEEQPSYSTENGAAKAKCGGHPALATVRAFPDGFAFLPIWGVEKQTKLDGSHLCGCGRFTCGSAGKHPIGPLVRNGIHDATADVATIARWFGQYPDANLGISSPDSRYVIIDEDPRNGGDADALGLPPTVTAQTGGGGRHFYFRVPEGVEIGNGEPWPGIEVKGAGVYVVAPPSRHASGEYYRWMPGRAPTEIEIAELPAHLVEQLRKVERLPSAGDNGPCDFEEAVSALNAIRAGLSYPEWRNASFGFADATRGDARAFAAFDAWCQTAPEKYDASKQASYWENFSRPGAITMATLFHIARENGWRPALSVVDKQNEADLRDAAEWACAPEGEAEILDMIMKAAERGAEAGDDAKRLTINGATLNAATPPKQTLSKRLQTQRASEIVPEPIHWLWRGWLAKGKLHVIAGQPGDGKSQISLELAATISQGAAWPDKTSAPVGNVLIWSGEDDIADTIIPRLMRMGADMDRIHFVRGTIEAGKTRHFDPARDIDVMQGAIDAIGDVPLVIVDPVISVASGKDSHKNSETRSALQPLVDLGASRGCAVLGIHHFSKGTAGRDPRERVTGSLAFGAAPRIVLATGKRQSTLDEEGPERIFVRAKSNIGPDGGGFGYELDVAPLYERPDIVSSRIKWLDPLEGTARELLAEIEQAPNADELKKKGAESVRQWLADFLATGPKPKAEIDKGAAARGFSEDQLRRAKSALRVVSLKERTAKGGWVWSMPADEDSPF